MDIKLDLLANGKVRVNATLTSDRGIESHMFFEGSDIADALRGLVGRYEDVQEMVVNKLKEMKLITVPGDEDAKDLPS